MTTLERFCRIDSHVNQTVTGKNYGEEKRMVLNGSGSAERRAYLSFPIPEAVIGADIVSAILTVYLASAWSSGPHTVTAKRVTESWKETKVTWANKPAVTATNSATDSVTGGAAGDTLDFNVTAMIAQVAAGAAFYGFELSLDTTGSKEIYASEAVADGVLAKLTIVYGQVPDAPTNLSPDGGLGVPDALPTYSWEFSTPDDAEAQGESQVQVDNNSDFSSTIYDSGWNANTETQWTQTSGSLSDNTTYYWRVRVRDSAGNESEWSETAEFTRSSYGTLTITEPTADLDNVDTNEPTIEHTFSGRTQQRVVYVLQEKRTGRQWVTVYQTTVIGTGLSFQLPAGWVRFAPVDAIYKIIVRVYDTIDRDVIPDSPPYVEAERTFEYVKGGVPADPTAVSVVQDGPGFKVSWTRTAIPTTFIITLNGEVIATLDPAAVSIGGNDYEYTFYEYDPQESNEVGVAAVASNQTSDVVTDTFTSSVAGIYLVEPETGLYVFIAGKAGLKTAYGEAGTTFFPIGRQSPVRVTDSKRGMEGSVNGVFLLFGSDTSEEMRENVLLMKELDTSTEFRLIWGHNNIPVIIGPLELEEIDAGEEMYNISFPFWQVRSFEIGRV